MKTRLLHVCHRCQRRNGGDCTIDGVGIIEHARQRLCSIGRYKLGLGDIIAAITYRTGIQWLLRKMRRKPGCGGCKARQMKLNGPQP